MISKIKLNIIANYTGSIWTTIAQLAFVPLYIKFMGIEAYGLVGFFGTLVAMFSILDMGLNATMNRELARRSELQGQEQASRDLVRTIETIYWVVAIIIGAITTLLSFPIANYWVKSHDISTADVQQAVMIMGLVIACRWPLGLYQGGLIGLQRQVLTNLIGAVFATFRGLGAVLVLWLVMPTIQMFFFWQIVVSSIETFTYAYFLWHLLPRSEKPAKFQKIILHDIWRFASGIFGINIVAMTLGQSDKIILSKMLTLEMFGYYMLASSVAAALARVASPISAALFPRFSQFLSMNKKGDIIDLYHRSCQLMSVMVLPAATICAIFAYQLLFLWTNDVSVAASTSHLLSVLIIGMAGNAIMDIPFAMQLAYGWTSLVFGVNAVAVIVLVPLLIFSASYYGVIGAAITWTVVKLGSVIAVMVIMHSRILRSEFGQWFRIDVVPPLVMAVVIAGVFRILVSPPVEKFWLVIYIGTVSAMTLGATAMTTQVTLQWIRNKIFGVFASCAGIS